MKTLKKIDNPGIGQVELELDERYAVSRGGVKYYFAVGQRIDGVTPDYYLRFFTCEYKDGSSWWSGEYDLTEAQAYDQQRRSRFGLSAASFTQYENAEAYKAWLNERINEIPLDRWSERIASIARRDGVDKIIFIPGVFEILLEYYNNDAIDDVARELEEEGAWEEACRESSPESP